MEIMKIVITYAEDSVIKPHMQMRKYNRTHTAFSYNCTITKIIDDKFRVGIKLSDTLAKLHILWLYEI